MQWKRLGSGLWVNLHILLSIFTLLQLCHHYITTSSLFWPPLLLNHPFHSSLSLIKEEMMAILDNIPDFDEFSEEELANELCVPQDSIEDLPWLFSKEPLYKRPHMSPRTRREEGKSDEGQGRQVPGKPRSKRAGGRTWSLHSPLPLGGSSALPVKRCCSHCKAETTPQWRAGPLGPKTLCNACGVRYKSGRLVPEYRPAASPTFQRDVHSNSHRKIMRMREGKVERE
eukprot:TRINITY_DN5033_c1_g2_i1.p1 TRINITY_DN5033_c1_g2~~TRINITY_DN5033_c1_g2_i1.p1  ORF type:complete len:228 (+),score=33.78 TRINITY_DN5033_c1_g2_i1:342-1025(+)